MAEFWSWLIHDGFGRAFLALFFLAPFPFVAAFAHVYLGVDL